MIYEKWVEIQAIRENIKRMGDKKRELESETRFLGQKIGEEAERLEVALDAYDKEVRKNKPLERVPIKARR